MSEERKEDSYVNIQFNIAIIQRFKEAKIEMDLMGSVMLILFGLFEGKEDLLDYADDANKAKRMAILYRYLCHKGLLEEEKEGKFTFKLSKNGTDFTTFLKNQYSEMGLVMSAEVLKPVVTIKDEEDKLELAVGTWIDKYSALFPSREDAGKMLRVHPISLIPKMKTFVKKYNYSEEIILKATRIYLAEQESSPDGYKYTRRADYFISKDAGEKYISDLATWCQKVVDMEEAGLDLSSEKLDGSFMDIM